MLANIFFLLVCRHAVFFWVMSGKSLLIQTRLIHNTRRTLLLFIGKWHRIIINNEHAKLILLINLFKETPSPMPSMCHLVREQFMFFLCGQMLFPGDLMLWGKNSICVRLGMILKPVHSARECLTKQVEHEVRWEKLNSDGAETERDLFLLYYFEIPLKTFFICPNKLESSHITLHNRRNFSIYNDPL